MRQDRHIDSDTRGVRHTRTSSLWAATSTAAVLLLILVVFIAQNSGRTRVHFFWATWTSSLAVDLLLAAVLGALVVLVVGALRVTQLRLAARRHLRGHDATYPTADEARHSDAPLRR